MILHGVQCRLLFRAQWLLLAIFSNIFFYTPRLRDKTAHMVGKNMPINEYVWPFRQEKGLM